MSTPFTLLSTPAMIIFMIATACLHSCRQGSESAEIRMVWRPDSLVTGADSCIQRYYLKGDRLGTFVWCPPTATSYLAAEQAMEVILARTETAALLSAADQVTGGENALGKGINTLKAGEAIIWLRRDHMRRGYRFRMEESPSAGLLHHDMRTILDARRKSSMK